MGPTGSTPKKGGVQTPTEVDPNSKTGLGIDQSRSSVPITPPQAHGGVRSPAYDCEVSEKSKLGIADSAPAQTGRRRGVGD
jgi:hypothetical protein